MAGNNFTVKGTIQINTDTKIVPLLYEIWFEQDMYILDLCSKRNYIFEKYYDASVLVKELKIPDKSVYERTSKIAKLVKSKRFDGILYEADRNPINGTIIGSSLALYNPSVRYKKYFLTELAQSEEQIKK